MTAATEWNKIANDPSFSQLSGEQKVRVRDRFFEKHIAPGVPQEKLGSVKVKFDALSGLELDNRSAGEWAMDLGASAASGAGNLMQSAKALAESHPAAHLWRNTVGKGYTALGLKQPTEYLGELAEGTRSTAEGYQSAQLKQAQQNVMAQDGFTNTLKAVADNPQFIPSFLAEQAPSFAVPLGAAKLAQLSGITSKAGMSAMALNSSAALEAGGGASEMGQRIDQMSPEELQQSPLYQEAIGLGFSHDEAKTILKTGAQLASAGASALVAVGAGKLTGAGDVAADVITGKMGGSIASRAATGAAREGAEEVLTEGGVALSGNAVAKAAVDDGQSLTEGVGQQAALGLLGGASMGAGFGAFSGRNGKDVIPDNKPNGVDLDDVMGEGILGQSLEVSPGLFINSSDPSKPPFENAVFAGRDPNGLSYWRKPDNSQPQWTDTSDVQPTPINNLMEGYPYRRSGAVETVADQAMGNLQRMPGALPAPVETDFEVDAAGNAINPNQGPAGQLPAPDDAALYVDSQGGMVDSTGFNQRNIELGNQERMSRQASLTNPPARGVAAYEQYPEASAAVDEAANESASSPLNDLPEPTDAQKEAGNYKKGHTRLHGLDIAIENPRGSKRGGTAPDGTKWESDMAHHYGYVKRTEGADGDQVDVFVGPNTQSEKVYVVDQVANNGDFDEHKVMMGFDSQEAAVDGYHANYEDGWQGMGAVTEMTVPEFKKWLKEGDTKSALSYAPQSETKLPPNFKDPRLRRDVYRMRLEAMADRDLVSIREGNQALVVDPNHRPGESDAQGIRPLKKSPSLNPEWFKRFNEEQGAGNRVSVDQARKIVRKALNGERLGVKQARFVEAMLDEVTGQRSEWAETLRRQRDFAREYIGFDDLPGNSGEVYAEEDYHEDADVVERIVAEVAENAIEQGADWDTVSGIIDQYAAPEAVERLYNLIYGLRNEHRENIKRQPGSQAEPSPGSGESSSESMDGEEANETKSREETLNSYTEEDLQNREQAKKQAEAAAKEADQRDAAQSEADDFRLTGSDRGADVAMARGQQDLLAAPVAKPDTSTPTTKIPSDTVKIDDFGEVLPDARKHTAWNFLSDVELLEDSDIANSTLSKLWPKNLVDQIEDNNEAALMFALRDEIPAKPRVSYKVKRWVESVKTILHLADFARKQGLTNIMKKMREKHSVLEPFADKVELLAAIDRQDWGRVDRVSKATGKYRPKDGDELVPGSWITVTIDGRSKSFYGVETVKEVVPDVIELLGESAGQSKRLKMSIYSVRGKEGAYIAADTDKEKRPLKAFDDVASARKFLKDDSNYPELEKAWSDIKERDNVKRSDLRRKHNRIRAGEDYRGGEDVSPEQFSDTFGFRGVQFGNWVKQGKGGRDRQGMLNHAYDALLDLAGIVGVPPKAISLNGELGLAFGARGQGWGSAHYESSHMVINLTKTKGEGSLAHEWFHALDHYFQRQRSKGRTDDRQGPFITFQPENYYRHKSTGLQMSEADYRAMAEGKGRRRYAIARFNADDWELIKGVRPEVAEAFAELVATLDESPMAVRSIKTDSGKSDGYWSRIIERAARSFENYVIAKMAESDRHNDYLANVSDIKDFARNPQRYPYLLDSEMAPVAKAFDNLFDTIETRETEQGLALFQAGTQEIYPDAIERIFSGNAKPERVVVIAPRNPVLQMLGVKRQPVIMHESKIDKNRYNHLVTAEHYKKLPNLMQDPLAVFESDTRPGRYVFMLDEHIDGKPLVAAVETDAMRGRYIVSVVASLYEKRTDPINRWIEEGKLLYLNNKKSRSSDATVRLQLPYVVQQNRTAYRGKNILSEKDLVKFLEDDGRKFDGATQHDSQKESTKDQVEQWVAPVVAAWGDFAPRVEVVESMAELPELEEAAQNILESGRFKAVMIGDIVYLVAGSMPDRISALKSLAHESRAHWGMQLREDHEYQALIERINWATRNNQYLKGKREEVMKELSSGAGTDSARVAEEVLAKVAEDMESGNKISDFARNLITRFMSTVRRFLRKIGFTVPWSTTDLKGLVLDHDKILRATKRPEDLRKQDIDTPFFQPETKGESDVMSPEEIVRLLGQDKVDELAKIAKKRRPAPRKQESYGGIDGTLSKVLAPRRTTAFREAAHRIREVLGDMFRRDFSAVSPHMSRFRQAFVNQFEALERYEKEINDGQLYDAAQSAAKAAAMTKNLDGVMAAIMHKGTMEWDPDAGVARIKKGSKSFHEIFKPLGDKGLLRLWEGWAAAQRAKRLLREGRENLFTADDVAALDKEVESRGLSKEFRRVQREWTQFNRDILDFAQAAGLIDPDARAAWESDDYVPFHRVEELRNRDGQIEVVESGTGTGNRSGGGLQGQSSKIKRLSGGVSRISPLESMVANTAHLIDASYKNIAMQRTVRMLEGVGMEDLGPAPMPLSDDQVALYLERIEIDFHDLTDEAQEMWRRKLEAELYRGKNVVSVRFNGRSHHYRVHDDLLFEAVTAMGAEKVGMFMKMLRFPTQVLRGSVTANPAFMFTNFVRDVASTWITSSPSKVSPLKPVAKAIRNVNKGWARSEEYWNILAAGAGSGFYTGFHEDPVSYLKDMKRWYHNPMKSAWQAWEHFGSGFESANRLAVYQTVLESGGTEAEAAYQALDVLNFSRVGTNPVAKFFFRMIPFLNARIQGLSKLNRGFKEHPVGFLMKGSIMMVASLLLAGANMDDDDYDRIENYRKDQYWHIKSPGGDWITIPKPFEVGYLFGTLPERIIQAIAKQDGKALGDSLLRFVSDTLEFSPFNMQFAKPWIEDRFNENFFTERPIVPHYMESWIPELQRDPWSSPSIVALAESMPAGAPDWARSPKRLEHYIRGYLGPLGGYATMATNWVIEGDSKTPELKVSRMPVISRFFSEANSRNRFVGDFYDLKKEVDALYSGYQQYIRQGEKQKALEIVAENGSKLKYRDMLRKTEKGLRNLSNLSKQVYTNKTMSASEKRRRLDDIEQRRNELAERAYKATGQ